MPATKIAAPRTKRRRVGLIPLMVRSPVLDILFELDVVDYAIRSPPLTADL